MAGETVVEDLAADRLDALALIVGRLKHSAKSDGMWEDSRDALMTLGYSADRIEAAIERYQAL